MIVCSCGRHVPTTPTNYAGTMVFDDCVLVLFHCACLSTRAICTWRAESVALEEAEFAEPLAAE